MRYIFFVLVAFALSVNAQMVRTGTVADESIVIERDSSATVLKWFHLIENHGIVLSYNSSAIDLQEVVTLKKQNVPVPVLLEQLLSHYDYEIQTLPSRKILLKIKGIKSFRLGAKVMDGETHERLMGCMVKLTDESGKCWKTTTDSQGTFEQQLPTGRYTMNIVYFGYRPTNRLVALTQPTRLDVVMDQLETPLQEVTVSPSPLLDNINYKGAKHHSSLNSGDPMSQINGMPGILGSTVAGNFHVNGGQSDENLVLMDGISLYHFHHNNSLLAQFNDEAVKKVAFYDSFIPAKYEGRLSSVTDVNIKEGDTLVHHQTIDLTLPSASVTFEGPIVKKKLTYVVSARHSWIDFMEDLFSSQPKATRTFKDLLGKLSYRINDRTSIHGLVYQSKDQYNDSVDSKRIQNILEWSTSLYSINLNTKLGDKVSHQNSISYTTYTNKIYGPTIDIDAPVYINEGMKKFALKSDYSMPLDRQVNLSWGLNLSHEKFNLLASQDAVENNDQHVTQLSSYVNSNLKFSKHLEGSVALNFVGYFPKDHPHSFSLQPRFVVRYLPTTHNTLTLSFSRMEQFYHNICLGEIPLPTDLRMPSIDGFKPSSSLHVEMGWKHIRQHWSGSVSSFYKRRYHILGVRYNIAPEYEGWNKFIMEGNASSYGLKVHSMGVWDRWLMDLSYTFSRSNEWFDEYKDNQKTPTLHDVPHIFNFAVSYRLKKNSFFTLSGYVKSGTMQPVFDYESNSNSFISSRKRDPFNHRLDFNYSDSFHNKKGTIQFSYKVGLYNIVGNPKENEVLDLYSTETRKHCLPYFTLKLKF